MYNLERFVEKQEISHKTVVEELSNGYKQSHWMWYTFPQLVGLGHSPMSYEYSIKSLEEAEAYLENDYLRDNLYELCNILLTLEKDDAYEIFGSPDHMKLKSSMTLFDFVMPSDVFERVLEKFFRGERCRRTMKRLNTE